MATALVIENDPSDGPGRLGDWLTEGGLELAVLRPYAGDSLPDDLAGYAALVVLGGEQQAYPRADGSPGAPWFPALEGLLRKAVRHRLPTLAVCLGAQLLATAHAGQVERAAEPEAGPGIVGKRDAADRDPLFRWVPLMPDVLHWHVDEITELPHGATLLAASTRCAHQAFRLGDRAWGLQFHLECDAETVRDWATGSELLAELGFEPDLVVAAATRLLPDVEEAWQPFAIRFAALARGELAEAEPRRDLPLLGH
ncbi:type 1 glutamine amidotransferase [Plantactinospora siamensis]|uniref:Type 1 glutamine amidotransferase n=1 Tax=Plantactinospora siamensis TaxID=555372 RepID=A0ABV6P045_9ACTN